MSKWNMIIDVAECTNCHLCTLATADEYVDNEFPGYAAPMLTVEDGVAAYVGELCKRAEQA